MCSVQKVAGAVFSGITMDQILYAFFSHTHYRYSGHVRYRKYQAVYMFGADRHN